MFPGTNRQSQGAAQAPGKGLASHCPTNASQKLGRAASRCLAMSPPARGAHGCAPWVNPASAPCCVGVSACTPVLDSPGPPCLQQSWHRGRGQQSQPCCRHVHPARDKYEAGWCWARSDMDGFVSEQVLAVAEDSPLCTALLEGLKQTADARGWVSVPLCTLQAARPAAQLMRGKGRHLPGSLFLLNSRRTSPAQPGQGLPPCEAAARGAALLGLPSEITPSHRTLLESG